MKLMILDGNSVVNRAYYGVRPLNAPDGTPTNAIFGFVNILQKLLDEQKPDALAVAFDVKAPTFRHKAFEGYKAKRKPMDENLKIQIPLLKETLDAMGIKRYELEGYEADDLLGTASAICEREGWQCVVVTGDRDSLQLVSDLTTVCYIKTAPGRTLNIYYTPETFREEHGYEPKSIVDYKALAGDSSDNYTGIPGIGDKIATNLILQYATIDEIYKNIDSVVEKPAALKKLREGEAIARECYWLASIVRDVPFAFEPKENLWNKNFKPELYNVFKRFGFTKFITKYKLTPPVETAEKAARLPLVELTDENAMQTLEILKQKDYIAVQPQAELDGVELCDGECVYTASWQSCGMEYNPLLASLFDGSARLVSHNVKDLMALLLKEGLSTDGFLFDTALAAYLLSATDSDYDLTRISQRYLGKEMDGTQAIHALYAPLKAKLEELGMAKLYYSAELPLCETLANMEHEGFMVDRQALYDFGESLNGKIFLLQQSIWSYAGHEFNINSPKQLGDVLFEELMLPSGKKTKTGWSTNADILDKLRGMHPIIDEILEYRMLTKLKSTYADGLLKVISADGRIHTSFQMTVTATGRLSSTEPNLQNIPIRKELGAEIRKMFVAAPGKCLVDADYSQIELRLLAHIADDKNMQAAFLSGEDFHRVTAAHVFNLPVEKVTPMLRSRAKAVNFGIVYGMSAFSLSQDIGATIQEAKEYMDSYFAQYKGVKNYLDTTVKKAKADGYVTTIYGRRRDLPEINASNFQNRQFSERVAMNMPIQGTAADIIKLAMVNVSKRLKAEGLEARLLLQVHDELIVECPEAEAQTVCDILKYEMEHAVELSVPLTVEAKIGHSWAEAH